MTKIRSTKNALISAILVLCMAFTGLLGTTFAWFTDSVTSSGNKIQAGTLKLDLELMDKNGNWKSLKRESAPIFDENAKWEPGYTEIKLLKVENEGNLALTWKTVLTKYEEISALAEVIDVYVRDFGVLDDAAASALTYPADRSLAGYTLVGTAAEFLSTMEATTKGFLEAEQSAYLGLALKMRESADNKYQGLSLGGTFDITVLATQGSFENDSFDETYDKNADWPYYSIDYTVKTALEEGQVDASGTLTEEIPVGAADAQVSAVVPSGVKMADGATSLDLNVKSMEAPTVDLDLEAGESAKSIDVHIDGVAEDNTTPMLVTLRQLFSRGLNSTSVKLYHVENGTPVEMTQVALADLDAHNEYYYDVATGDVIMSVASFSEYTVIEDDLNLWKGGFDTDWYNKPVTETIDGVEVTVYTINSADELAGFGKLVDEGNTFAGKIIRLDADIDLAGGYSLNPIGFGYDNADFNSGDNPGYTFNGTFDGQNHTIRNLYQNGWEIGLSYTNAGGGLFASVCNATIKNLTMVNAEIVMECVEQGVIAGLAQGNCTFENITIYGCSVANYQRATGGVVGEVSPKFVDGVATESIHTFKNIKIDSTTVVGSLWGDFDAPVGGVIGGYWDDSGRTKVEMENVDVACRLDVYNDITSSYQWHAYRRAGMLIGNTDNVADDGHTAEAKFLTCKNVTVRYGDWRNYHYCEFNNHEPRWPFVRVEAGENCTAFSNPRWGVPNGTNGIKVTPENHSKQDYTIHQEGDDCYVLLEFNQLYGGGQGVYGVQEHINEDGTNGVTTSIYAYAIQYVNDNKLLAESYVKSNTSDYILESDSNYNTAVEAAETWVTSKGYNVEFGGWVNAGSTKVTKIPAGTTGTVKLYPHFNSPHTARFVDQNGNVLAWCLFHSDKLGELKKTEILARNQLTFDEHFEFDYWEIHYGEDSSKYPKFNENDVSNFAGYDQDVTIYPVYKFKGDVTLIPVDSDGDGETNYYQVSGYSNPNGQALVEIPAYVNGKPVTEISGGAFSSYDGVHSILIPKDVTYIGNNAFAEKWGTIDSGESITIYYGGSYADWVKIENNFDSEWESGVSSSTRIFFLNGGETVDVSQGYLQAEVKSSWGKRTVTWNHNTTISVNIKNEYTGKCNCTVSTTGDTAHIYVDANEKVMEHNDAGTPVNSNGKEIYFQDGGWFGDDKLTDGTNTYYRYRPDAKYWEGVTVN